MVAKIPKKLLSSEYRRQAWGNAQSIIAKIEKVLPISEVHVMGSFTTKKRRPADVDFMVLLTTPSKKKNWSVDLVIAPDNKHGEYVKKDAELWLKQKYGAKGTAMIRLR
jgi:hypothetical protein